MSEARNYLREVETLDNGNVEAAYARWAPIYDLTFDILLKPGRRAAATAASKARGPILDVGVGTGLELPMFAPDTQVIGVDLSEPMLRRAAQRVRRERLDHVAGLVKMDATRMAFADATFGCVVAPYMLTVVPEPQAVLDELARVLRPGGEIVLVNHVSGKDDAIALFEAWLDRHMAPKLGWRPQFPWSIIGGWIDRNPHMRLVERRPLAPFGLFTLTRIERVSADSKAREKAAPLEVAFA